MATRIRILDAAERLFAERGYHAASLRAITAEAGVNLAAVNYHFHSKDALLKAVLVRRMGPLNEERLSMLDRLEEAAAGGCVPLEKLVRAMVEPILRLGSGPREELESFRKLLGRMYSDPDHTQRVFGAELENVIRRFGAALRRACPEIPPGVLAWRVHFIIGAMAHALVAGSMLRIISDGRCDPADTDNALRQLIAFAIAGLAAPLSADQQFPAPGAAAVPPPAERNEPS